MGKIKAGLLLILSLALIAGVALVKRNQELRKGAAFAQAKVWFLPTDSGNKKVGDSFPVYLVADFGDKRVVAFTLKINYSKDKLTLDETDIVVHSGFNNVIQKRVDQEKGAVYVTALFVPSADQLEGGATGILGVEQPLMKLNFEIKAAGSAEVKLDRSYPQYQVVAQTNENIGEIELKNQQGDSEIAVSYNFAERECQSKADCDDGNPCTEKDCINGECTLVKTASDGTSCGTNMVCTNAFCGCASGFGDCDNNPANGCETNLNTNKTNCGQCGNNCSSDQTCRNGQCVTEQEGVECTDGQKDCGGPNNRPRACVNGTWEVQAPCGTGESCVQGDCVPEEQPLATEAPTPTNLPSPTATLAPTETLLLSPTPTVEASTPILNFKVSFAGVLDSSKVKETPEVTVKIKKGLEIVAEFTGVQLEPDTGAAFKGSVVLSGVAPGGDYTIYIKGPRHLVRKFCQDKQTERCFGRGRIVLTSGKNEFDFSRLSLEPGDLPNPSENMQQDSVVNGVDLSLLKARLGKDYPEELAVADLDFNGVINTRDIVLLLRTLSSKYGEEE